jgi:hypothetical protein
MKTLFALAIALCAITATVEAQTPVTLGPNCQYAWTASPESDVTKYHLYLKKDGVQMPSVFIQVPATKVTCKEAGVISDGVWVANVHAINSAGNESEQSNTVTFTENTKAPAAPVGFRAEVIITLTAP